MDVKCMSVQFLLTSTNYVEEVYCIHLVMWGNHSCSSSVDLNKVWKNGYGEVLQINFNISGLQYPQIWHSWLEGTLQHSFHSASPCWSIQQLQFSMRAFNFSSHGVSTTYRDLLFPYPFRFFSLIIKFSLSSLLPNLFVFLPSPLQRGPVVHYMKSFMQSKSMSKKNSWSPFSSCAEKNSGHISDILRTFGANR